MKPPTLSIIIPVYNASGTISTIVSSILNQTFQDFELILVDDGSTDSTLNVLRGLKKRDQRIVLRSKKNGGPSSARNDGLSKAHGKYVLFFDADDDIDQRMLELMVRTIGIEKSDLVVSGWQIDLTVNKKPVKAYKTISPKKTQITGDQSELKKHVLRSIGNEGLLYNLWNKMFKMDIINEHDLRFREDIRFGEDLIFSFHYLNHVARISITPEPLYHYQVGSMTSVFSTSALNPEYRHINNEELDLFAGTTRDRETDDLTQWIKWRWLLSYYRIVAGSNLPRDEKIRLIRANSHDRPKMARDALYIRPKKLALERLGYVVSRSPQAALAFGVSAQKTKNSIIRLKSSRRS